MFKYLLKILLVLSLGIVVSCAKRNPEPISSEDFLKSAEDDLAKIQEIKEQNDLFNKDLKIDLYTAIALAIENNKDLKVKLLQGASLEEPLFGPKGKHPKIIREPRLPEVQLALPQQDVPVSPKQSVVPDINGKVLELNIPNKAKKPGPLENDKTFLNSNLNQQKNQNNNTKNDSLKLEQSKNLKKTNLDIPPPDPEMNQSEIENMINNDE